MPPESQAATQSLSLQTSRSRSGQNQARRLGARRRGRACASTSAAASRPAARPCCAAPSSSASRPRVGSQSAARTYSRSLRGAPASPGRACRGQAARAGHAAISSLYKRGGALGFQGFISWTRARASQPVCRDQGEPAQVERALWRRLLQRKGAAHPWHRTKTPRQPSSATTAELAPANCAAAPAVARGHQPALLCYRDPCWAAALLGGLYQIIIHKLAWSQALGRWTTSGSVRGRRPRLEHTPWAAPPVRPQRKRRAAQGWGG